MSIRDWLRAGSLAAAIGCLLAAPAPAQTISYSPPTGISAGGTDVVRHWGADPSGVADSTAALNAAAASGQPLYIPAGTYLVTDLVTFGNAQTVRGDGRTKSILRVTAAFNMAALGVVRMGTNETTATSLYDIGITFDQPDSAVRASYTQYPPAIYAVATPRVMIDRVRISGAWDGIKATGNTGGAFFGDLEIGALNKGFEMDGSLDFVHGGHWHFWAFGFTTANRLTAYSDGGTVGMQFGLVESLEIGAVTTYRAKLNFTTAATTTAGHIGRMSLDGNEANLSVTGQQLLIGSLYTTKVAPSATSSVFVGAAGVVTIGMIEQVVTNLAHDFHVNGAGAQLIVNGGRSLSNELGFSAFHVTAGVLSLNNVTMRHPGAGVRTVGSVHQTAGALIMSGNTWTAKAGASGPALVITAANAQNHIANNNFADWDVTFPATLASGEYGPNNVKPFVVSPTVTFTTVGDFVPTYTGGGTTTYQILGARLIQFDGFVQFNTNAYTTAAGAFVYGLGIPYLPVLATAVQISQMSNITWTTTLQWAAIIGSGGLNITLATTNAGVTNMGVANVPASKTGVLIRVSGLYRY